MSRLELYDECRRLPVESPGLQVGVGLPLYLRKNQCVEDSPCGTGVDGPGIAAAGSML
jgi:hypothetical protein